MEIRRNNGLANVVTAFSRWISLQPMSLSIVTKTSFNGQLFIGEPVNKGCALEIPTGFGSQKSGVRRQNEGQAPQNCGRRLLHQ
jgi:hypothetical protein